MGSKSGYPGSNQLDAVGMGRVLIAGRITTADGTAPTITAGSGFTVARTAEGRFTITLSRAVMEIVSIVVSLAREGLPSITSDIRELVQCFVDQDTIDTDSFEVQLRLTDTLGTTPDAVLDDQPGAEIHFQVIGRYSSVDY